jgi:hypothetical protein
MALDGIIQRWDGLPRQTPLFPTRQMPNSLIAMRMSPTTRSSTQTLAVIVKLSKMAAGIQRIVSAGHLLINYMISTTPICAQLVVSVAYRGVGTSGISIEMYGWLPMQVRGVTKVGGVVITVVGEVTSLVVDLAPAMVELSHGNIDPVIKYSQGEVIDRLANIPGVSTIIDILGVLGQGLCSTSGCVD